MEDFNQHQKNSKNKNKTIVNLEETRNTERQNKHTRSPKMEEETGPECVTQ